MALLGAIKAIGQSADEADPHILGFQTARAGANALLFDVWNAATSAGRKFSLDLDGKWYSAAFLAGGMPYAVTGGVTGVRRFDALAIGTAGQALKVNAGATAPEWGAIGVAGGGTGLTTFTAAGALVYATAATTLAALAIGTAGQALKVNAGATAPEWGAIAVAGGGTGLTTFTAAGALIYSTAATTLAALAIGTANQLLRVNAGATAPEWASTLSGLTLASPIITGALSIGTNPAGIGDIRLRNLGAIRARNAANSSDVELIILGGTDVIRIGATVASKVTIGEGTGELGFLGTSSAAKQTVTGSRGGNAALASLLTALAAYGLITDSTS